MSVDDPGKLFRGELSTNSIKRVQHSSSLGHSSCNELQARFVPTILRRDSEKNWNTPLS